MDNKETLFRAIFAAALVFLIWNLFFGPRNLPKPEDTPDVVEVQPDVTAPRDNELTLHVAADEQIVDLGNVDDLATSPYRMHLQFTNRGAALLLARLTDHQQTVNGEERYAVVTPLAASVRARASFLTPRATLGLAGATHVVWLDEALWRVDHDESAEGDAVTFTLDVSDPGGAALARFSKRYELAKSGEGEDLSDVDITLGIENLTARPISVKWEQMGPVGIPKEDPRQDFRRISAALFDGTVIKLEQQEAANLEEPWPFPEKDVRWLASANKFFAVIMAPRVEGPNWIRAVRAEHVGGLATPEDVTFVFSTQEAQVAAQAGRTWEYDCYVGPKSKHRFSNGEYAQRNYVDLINHDYYMCAWTAVVNVMLWLLNGVHAIWPHNYGLAIIVLVLVVRTLLHPLTKKGQVNMTRLAEQMGKLQPKLEVLKEKHANDKPRFQSEMMKLYQEEGVNPAGQMLTCLPMMCQLPIWAGLWAALQHTVEMRHQPFVGWINDLTAPDALITFAKAWPMIGEHFNLLPLLLGLSMYLQQRLMPKPAQTVRRDGKSPDQLAQQRLMMTIMSVMMIFFFYSAPSGLTLYIMASNFFGLIEQHRIRKHIKEQGSTVPEGPKRQLKKPGFLQKLEKLAEEAKRQQQLQQKDGRRKPKR